MNNTTVVGYRLKDPITGRFINHDGNGYLWVCNLGSIDPAPVVVSEAYRLVGKWLEVNDPDQGVPQVVPVTREMTPMETASQELGSMLSSLCARHGLNLGLSQAQIERQIAKELAELGAKAR